MTTIFLSAITQSLHVIYLHLSIEIGRWKYQNFGTNLAKYVEKRGVKLFCCLTEHRCRYVDDKCKYEKYTYSLEKCHKHVTPLLLYIS